MTPPPVHSSAAKPLRPVALAAALALALALLFAALLRAGGVWAGSTTIAQTGTITGHVTASDGAALGPLRVTASAVHSTDARATELDEAGYYTITGLTPDAYTVIFNISDEGPYLSEFYNNRPDFASADPVTVAAGATVSGIDAVLQRGGMISGTVTDDSSGAPLAGISVAVEPRTGPGTNGRYGETDTAGRYMIEGLIAGDYSVCFDDSSADGLTRYLAECYDDRASRSDAITVTITAGATLTNINAALARGGVITGRVTAETTGAPLPNIRVRADAEDLDLLLFGDTDTAGVYTITGIPTGNYTVHFNASGFNAEYADEYYDNQSAVETADPVAVTARMTTTNINAALRYLVNITGRVELAATHAPLDSVEVYAYNADGETVGVAFADDSGRYTMTSLAAGAYRIRFGRDVYLNEYYDNKVLFEEATPVNVISNVVTTGIDASLVPRQGTDLAVATASTLPNAVIVTRQGNFGPIFSLDNGESWQTFATLPFQDFTTRPEVGLVPKDDPAQPIRFLLGQSSRAVAGNNGVYRSADARATWALFTPPNDLRCDPGHPNDVLQIVTSPVDPQRVYAVTLCTKYIITFEPYDKGFWRLYASSNGGVTWERVAMPPDDSPGPLYPFDTYLQPSPAAAEVLYQYSDRSTTSADLWQRSDNGGQSWITETFRLKALALDWSDPAKLYGVAEDQDTALFTDHVFRYTGQRSANRGDTWQDWAEQPCRTSFRQLISLATSGTLLMLCDQGLYRSVNGGDHWELLTTQTGGQLAPHWGDHEVVLWMRGSELWRSRDQGATWANLGGWQEIRLPRVHGHE